MTDELVRGESYIYMELIVNEKDLYVVTYIFVIRFSNQNTIN